MSKYSPEEIELWKERLRDAKAKNWKFVQFCKKYSMSSGGTWQNLKKEINDPELTDFKAGMYKPRRGGRKLGSKNKSTLEKESLSAKSVNYHPVLLPEVVPDKPVFCLIVAFDSKEAALKAMGRYL